jgi:hypothetical protein
MYIVGVQAQFDAFLQDNPLTREQQAVLDAIREKLMLAPDLPDGAFTVTDCVRFDQPRQKRTNPNEPRVFSGVCFTIIGGSDGPTAIIFGGSGQGKLHVVCSALHFEPMDDVEWRMVFHEKSREDVTVELI